MTKVDPDEDEEAKVGADNGGVKIVECFGCLGREVSRVDSAGALGQ